MKRRYCELCDVWTNANPCKECGAVTTKAAPENPRERDEDDAATYADPRDERDSRRFD
jgi:hypothetical protein